ncbi:MAG TPA: hypothetical protein VHM90_01095 [Phycisphaerae bacterium]|jgi:hypothetical protein|nr:hypothetical protein [Phycisphaerae bacterium]
MPQSRAADLAPANSRRALMQVVHELDVDGASLGKVIDYLHNVTGANIVVDWKTLELAGVAKESTVSLRVRELTLKKMLQLVLNQVSPNSPLTYGVDANVIEITTQEALDKNMVTKVYIVDDLVMVGQTVQAPTINLSSITSGSSGNGGGGFGSGGGGFGSGGGGGGGFGSGGGGSSGGFFNQNQNQQTAQNKETSDQKGQELVDLIKSVVRPAIWSDNGGTASIKYYKGKLIVTAPVSVHEAIGGPIGDSGIRYGY